MLTYVSEGETPCYFHLISSRRVATTEATTERGCAAKTGRTRWAPSLRTVEQYRMSLREEADVFGCEIAL